MFGVQRYASHPAVVLVVGLAVAHGFLDAWHGRLNNCTDLFQDRAGLGRGFCDECINGGRFAGFHIVKCSK